MSDRYRHDHIPVFHNDGKEDWCNICKLNSDGNDPQYTLEYEVKNFLTSETMKQHIDPAGTPDRILAEFLLTVLGGFHKAIETRMEWKGETKEQLAAAKIQRNKLVAKAVRQALPEYGSEDHGTFDRQADAIAAKVLDALDKQEHE